MNNSIYLRRSHKVWIATGQNNLPENYIAALLKNLEDLGWTLTPELVARLQTLSLGELTVFYEELISTLRVMVGAHRKFKPMYPSFPQQVMEMAEARLYLNALIHYWTNKLPVYPKQARKPLADQVALKPIGLGTEEEFKAIFSLLVGAKGSLSPQDKEDVAWFVSQEGEGIFECIPQEIPARETVALLGSLLLQHTNSAQEFLSVHIKTATDVLRLAVALSGGDISLALPAKFITFKRSQRRMLLALLETCPNLLEDMLRWKIRWVRLGEKLHVGEFASRFPRAFEAFDALRNNKRGMTFNSRIESALEKQDADVTIELARTRPGDFARRLDTILRRHPQNTREILGAFGSVASRVSTPVLLQMLAHFKRRLPQTMVCTFFPKGNVGKAFASERPLPPLDSEVCQAVVALLETTLRDRFAALPPLGRCYLEPDLVKFPVPGAQRSASKSLRTLPRGSRLPLPEGNVLRFFLWWKNGRERTDIDLSAALYDDGFIYKDVVSYYNLKNFGGHHSGDIVDAPHGAAEFIDLDTTRTVEMGVRYIVMSVNSYTTQPFCDLPECFAGWMSRQHADSGEIFEPKTVQDRIDLAAETRICLPLIMDLVEREAIWADLALTRYPSWNNVNNVQNNLRSYADYITGVEVPLGNNVQDNLTGVSLMLRAMTSLVAPNLHELFDLHIQARGQQVEHKTEADTIFSLNQGITPFDLDIIKAKFL